LLAAPGFAQTRDQRDQAQIDVELLTRAENRSDALRAQLLDLQMKEIDLQARLDDLDYRLKPESINQALVFVGSVRPLDELRDDLRARIESEKTRVNAQLELLASTQARIEAAISDADSECARLRQRLRLLSSGDGCREDNGAAPGDDE
jgi:septal ring factor EnvC (AmiA/AmiB activator)